MPTSGQSKPSPRECPSARPNWTTSRPHPSQRRPPPAHGLWPPAAAAVRPTLKRDTSTVLDAVPVHRTSDRPQTWCAHRYSYNAPAPREKRGRRSVACRHARDFAQPVYHGFLASYIHTHPDSLQYLLTVPRTSFWRSPSRGSSPSARLRTSWPFVPVHALLPGLFAGSQPG
jgi:hypothetical protein